MMKNLRFSYLLLAFLLVVAACKKETNKTLTTKTATDTNGLTYEYVENDPMSVRIYTLANGLKVYLSAYNAEPRIQTYIAVNAGGKDDPAHATGLAHYLEHMMFKGTSEFGTKDWAKETVLIDSIERMFEHYRTLTDPQERKAYYQRIDKVSGEAAQYAIANEYDKMISEIGAKGTNAYTSEDRTVYINDIPANELERFLQIEAKRFRLIVNRLFHTELEAVYEEKNRGLDNDSWKVFETINAQLFPSHPYGTQTVIGTIEHLKNPSITEIKKYFDKYYTPSNVAICLSGDLDYDKTIRLINQYFGDWEKKAVDKNQFVDNQEINTPIAKEIFGPTAANVYFAYRIPARNHPDYQVAVVADMLLANEQAGLIDLNLKQQQKVLRAGAFIWGSADYGRHIFYGYPRENQSLEEVKELVIGQINLLKEGKFEEQAIKAVITNLKKQKIEGREQNENRAHEMVEAFNYGISWEQWLKEMEVLENISKQQIVDFVNKYYKENYVVVYKRNGEDNNKQKVEKPEITKVTLDRESVSPFHQTLLAQMPPKVAPVFLDFAKDIKELKMSKGVPILYKQNTENQLFKLYYLVDRGTNNDPRLSIAFNYLKLLGTDKISAADFQKEMFRLGASFNVFAGEDNVYVSLSGLNENMEASVELFENLLANAKADTAALQAMKANLLKDREDLKKNKNQILFQALKAYGKYGAKSPFTNVLSSQAINALTAQELIGLINGLTKQEHRVLYYGQKSEQELLALLDQKHVLPQTLTPLPQAVRFSELASEPKVYWANYDMVQAEILLLGKGNSYDKNLAASTELFNEYFGNIVFQEIREAQGLAYAVSASYRQANRAQDADYLMAYVGTQSDKQPIAMQALTELMKKMPLSETSFETAKKAILNKIESERILRQDILFAYESAKKRNLDFDLRKEVYEQVQKMSLADLQAFHNKQIASQNYLVLVLGNRKNLNFKDLAKYGKVQELTLEELFGY